MPYLSIKDAAEEIHSGLITPAELVAETLERIDTLDGDLKAFITVMRDQAYEDAERLERELRTGLYRSPLHGIPSGGKTILPAKVCGTRPGPRWLPDNFRRKMRWWSSSCAKKGLLS